MMHGSPVRRRAYVKLLSDGQFTYTTPMFRGLKADLGPLARLQLAGGIDLLVASRRQQVFDPELFLLKGIGVARFRIVALKSAHHFRAGFESLGRIVVTSDAPGLTSERIDRLGHRRVRRPIWPLDSDVTYEPGWVQSARPAQSG